MSGDKGEEVGVLLSLLLSQRRCLAGPRARKGIGPEKAARGGMSVNRSPAVVATASPGSVRHPVKAGLDGGPGRAEGGLGQPAQHLGISSIIQE